MKEHNDDIHLKHLLQDKLGEHTVEAPEFVWSAIEKEMFPPAKKRRPFFWWFLFTGLFIGGVTFYFIYPQNEFNFNFETRAFVTLKKASEGNSKTTQTYKSQLDSTKTINEKTIKTTNSATNFQNNEHASYLNQKNGKTFLIRKTNSTSKNTNNYDRTKKQKTPVQPAILLANSETENKNTKETKTELGNNESKNNIGEERSNVLNQTNLTNEFPNLEMSLLVAKSLDHTAFSIPLESTNLRYPRKFVPYSFLDFYGGTGKNHREYTGSISSNQSNKALLIDRTIKFKNRNIGFDYNLQFCRFASFRLGINTGTNRYTTRLFPIRIANVSLNDPLDISSPSGDLKSAPLNLDDQASSTSDSTTFLMRIIHKSSYYTVPLSIRFNTTNIRGPQLFAYTGFDLNFRGNDKNTLIVRRFQVERVFSTSKPANAQTLYLGWHFGMGIASNPIRRLQVFSEFNYSSLFSDYYTGKIISIQSSNYQINVGLRFKLVSNHDTKRLVK